MANSNRPNHEAQEFVEKARTAANLAKWRLAHADQLQDALTRLVAYEKLASNSRTREEAIGHFAAVEGVLQELAAIDAAEAKAVEEALSDEAFRMKRSRAILSGALKPTAGEREI